VSRLTIASYEERHTRPAGERELARGKRELKREDVEKRGGRQEER